MAHGKQKQQEEDEVVYELASEFDDWEVLQVPEISTPIPAAVAVDIKSDYFAIVADEGDVEESNLKVYDGDLLVGSEKDSNLELGFGSFGENYSYGGFLLLDESMTGERLDMEVKQEQEELEFEDNTEEKKRDDLISEPVFEGLGCGKHHEIDEGLHFEGINAEIDAQNNAESLHFQGTNEIEEGESLDLEGIAAAMDANERQRDRVEVGECSRIAQTEEDDKPFVESSVPIDERGESGVAWWKVPLELLKYWAFKVRPLWSISMVVAFVGLVMLGRRMKRMMRRRSRGIPLKLALDDARASQFAARTARLNEAFSVVRRAPAIRAPSLAEVTPWSVVELR